MSFPGSNPFFLIVMRESDRASVVIDLDEPGWSTKWEARLREPGRWALVRKMTQKVALSMLVFEGEEPYYLDRKGGDDRLGAFAFGIGKRRIDGHHDRMWVLPDGSVCGGDDVDVILDRMVQSRMHLVEAPL